jgi:xylulokinase
LAFLVFDVGTGGLRAGVVAGDGTALAQARIPLRDSNPAPDRHEIATAIWWRALRRAAGQVLDRAPPDARIAGICLGGATRAQVFLDEAGRPLAPALLFRDRRAVAAAEEVAAWFPQDNAADAITAFHPLARVAWFEGEEPALAARLHTVCEPKDYLNFRLTGRIAGDSVTYSRYDDLRPAAPAPDWLTACLARLQIERLDPWSVLGPCVAEEPPFERLAGVPVFAGAMDAWMAAVGAGAAAPGQAYDVAGTSEVAGRIVATRTRVPGLVSLRWSETAFHLGGPTQAGGDSARWAYDALRVRGKFTEAVERAGALTPRPDLPLFLPYLAGERTPVWRPDLRAAFHGVARDHGPDELLWAVLEGVALAVRDILDQAAHGSGEPLAEVRIAGGGARSDAWCQLKADVLGVPVLRVAESETGLTGAAIAAATGAGLYPTIAAAARAMTRVERAFAPRPALAALFAARAALYARAKAVALAG